MGVGGNRKMDGRSPSFHLCFGVVVQVMDGGAGGSWHRLEVVAYGSGRGFLKEVEGGGPERSCWAWGNGMEHEGRDEVGGVLSRLLGVSNRATPKSTNAYKV